MPLVFLWGNFTVHSLAFSALLKWHALIPGTRRDPHLLVPVPNSWEAESHWTEVDSNGRRRMY